MTAHGMTLDQIKAEALPEAGQYFRASDFLSDEEKQQIRESNAKGKEEEKPYDQVDAFEAEMIARFGFDFFQAWLKGTISEDFAMKAMAAERDREKANIEIVCMTIFATGFGANNPDKNGHAPKTLRLAQDILTKLHK